MDLLQRIQDVWRREGCRGETGHWSKGAQERGDRGEQTEEGTLKYLENHDETFLFIYL